MVTVRRLSWQFCWGFAYTTASLFFAVAEIAVDTVLLSYCIDAEENKGTAVFAPASLAESLNTFTESEEARAAERDFRKRRSSYYEEDNDHDDNGEKKDRSGDTSDSDSGSSRNTWSEHSRSYVTVHHRRTLATKLKNQSPTLRWWTPWVLGNMKIPEVLARKVLQVVRGSSFFSLLWRLHFPTHQCKGRVVTVH